MLRKRFCKNSLFTLHPPTESPAIPTKPVNLFDIKLIIGVFFEIMFQILYNHVFGKLSRGNTKVTSRPKMFAPIPLLHMGKFFKYFARHPTLHSPHNIRWGNTRRCGYQDMHMIFTNYITLDMYLKTLTDLSDQLSDSKSNISSKNMIAILRNPDKMIFNLIFWMTSLTIFDAKKHTPTARKILPVWKTGVLTFYGNNKWYWLVRYTPILFFGVVNWTNTVCYLSYTI